jgi:hypothetical protein
MVKSDRPRPEIVTKGEGVKRPVPYRWTVRGVSPDLVRRMRILAVRRGASLAVLVDMALEQFLDAHEG